MGSLNSALRAYTHIIAFVLLLILTGGSLPARADGVNETLANGQVVYGTISSTGLDQYRFYGGSGHYWVIVWEYAGHSTSSWAAYKIYYPDGSNGPGPYCDYAYSYAFDAGIYTYTGYYSINITNCTGGAVPAAAYALQVIAAPGPGSPGQPAGYAGGTMQPGTTYSGTINVGEQDAWTFQGNGQIANLAFAKTSGGSGYCPEVRIVYPDGSTGAYQSCTSDSTPFWTQTGTHYLVVQNDTWGTADAGGYTLEVSGTGADLPIQGKTDGSTCIPCRQKALAAQSGGVTSTGGVATKK